MLDQLNPGETLLIEAIKVANGKIQLHFAEALEQEREPNVLAMFNRGDDRFAQGGKARHCWKIAEPAAASNLFNINLMDDAEWTMNDSGKETVQIGILNPTINGKRLRLQITETITPRSEWDTENIEAAAKRKGKNGDFITHKGYHIFTMTDMVLSEPKHTFLEADQTQTTKFAPIQHSKNIEFDLNELMS